MPSDGDSFLPRILSVFYAVFDVRQGPKIVYQVPEGLIAVSAPPSGLSSFSSVPPTPSSDTPPAHPFSASRNSSIISVLSPDLRQHPRGIQSSPAKRSASSNRILFNFDDISKYVIPPSPLCGRLVICATRRHRIIGFPVELPGKYQRNYFRYNVCFVFERAADLSCYEPIVRKVSRVLRACEEESEFLSSSTTSPTMHAILEQLYEDLNSYSETSIPIDQFNSIELKIFPFYPNPVEVHDWMVPVALINLTKRMEDNWDLTMVKVCKYIDGTNHVSRIAHLADCDVKLTRLAISHLLYYQVIMTCDIFQYSNMYTTCKSIQWLADEAHVKEECGPYVTKPGATIPPWPQLLHLYSRLKSGRTVLEWMELYNVQEQGIDVRRFTSFGIIKGFLRRVHRWPYLPQTSAVTTTDTPNAPGISATRPRLNSVSGGSLRFSMYGPPSPTTPVDSIPPSILRTKNTPSTTMASINSETGTSSPTTPRDQLSNGSSLYRPRRPSAAEKVLEQVRSRDRDHQRIGAGSPRTSWIQYPSGSSQSSTSISVPGIMATSSTPQESPTNVRNSLISSRSNVPPNSPTVIKVALPRPRLSRSPSAPVIPTVYSQSFFATPVPAELAALLDGEHHTDELAVRFEAGWPLMEQWLMTIGGGAGEGDFGGVSIIYR
ncbi:NPR2-domain-containing protein [Mycena floridula]|nr:NPR2-domain-containing protein [Mycena floridula]